MKQIFLLLYNSENEKAFVNFDHEAIFIETDEQPTFNAVLSLLEKLNLEAIAAVPLFVNDKFEVWQPLHFAVSKDCEVELEEVDLDDALYLLPESSSWSRKIHRKKIQLIGVQQ